MAQLAKASDTQAVYFYRTRFRDSSGLLINFIKWVLKYYLLQNVHLKKCPSRISLLFPIYNNVSKNTFYNFKLPYIKLSRHHKSLSFKGPKSWNNLCLNKLLFTKIYIKNLKKNLFIKI